MTAKPKNLPKAIYRGQDYWTPLVWENARTTTWPEAIYPWNLLSSVAQYDDEWNSLSANPPYQMFLRKALATGANETPYSAGADYKPPADLAWHILSVMSLADRGGNNKWTGILAQAKIVTRHMGHHDWYQRDPLTDAHEEALVVWRWMRGTLDSSAVSIDHKAIADEMIIARQLKMQAEAEAGLPF